MTTVSMPGSCNSHRSGHVRLAQAVGVSSFLGWKGESRSRTYVCHCLHTTQHLYAGEFLNDCVQDSETPSQYEGVLCIFLADRIASSQSCVYYAHEVVKEVWPVRGEQLTLDRVIRGHRPISREV